ncbi:MAG: glycoside hydrolase family 44 protein [Candidatus Eisenbacteria bacterium]
MPVRPLSSLSSVRLPSALAETVIATVAATALAAALTATALTAYADAATLPVYQDALENGFVDWSWATHDLAETDPVHGGTYSISMWARNWEGLYFHRDLGWNVSELDTLRCWVRGGGASSPSIRLVLQEGGSEIGSGDLGSYCPGGAIPVGSWAEATVPLASIGAVGGVPDGIIFQAFAAADQGTVYLDDIELFGGGGGSAPSDTVDVTVDVSSERRVISPGIYGINFGSDSEWTELPYTVRRWGGNSVTRYNYVLDTFNTASDWFYMNIPNDHPDPGQLPDGSAADRFAEETLTSGADVLLTVPTIGWTPNAREKRWGFSVDLYGEQEETECTASGWQSWCQEDAGNGILIGGVPVTGNDPLDTSIPVGPSFAEDWLAHLSTRVGTASQGGIRYYALDNEPMLWSSTHRDVHPDPVDYDELWSRSRDYAAAIKASDPGAEVFGPAVWGWCAYFFSAEDGCGPGGDHAAHGGMDVLPWYLDQAKQYELTHGTRILDYLDIHYYPQAAGVALSDDESSATSARRLRSVRSLYDPTYVDESWIGQPVRLIPRMREWIDEYYPGTKLAITEYNWGGDSGLSSALAQAEVLAVFGREGVDVATRWVAPAAGSRVADAFRVFLDVDGAGTVLTGTSVHADASAPDDLGAYAVEAEDGRLFVVAVCRATSPRLLRVAPGSGWSTTALLYRMDGSNSYGPAGTIEGANGTFEIVAPGRSVSVLELASGDTSGSGDDGAPGDGNVPGDGGVGLTDDASSLALEVTPSPFAGEAQISWRHEGDAPDPVFVQIYAATGRRVRAWIAEGSDASLGRASWDGKDDAGGSVAAGLYFVRADRGAVTETVRVVKVR